jgi:hypothetical protein
MFFVGRYSMRILILSRRKRVDHFSVYVETEQGSRLGELRESVPKFLYLTRKGVHRSSPVGKTLLWQIPGAIAFSTVSARSCPGDPTKSLWADWDVSTKQRIEKLIEVME